MKRLFALVFFMTLLFVFISCSEATPFKTDETTHDLTETKNDPITTENESEKLPETGEIISTEAIPPQTTSSSTTTTTTIPSTTTTVPLTTTIKPTTKVPSTTTTPSAAYEQSMAQSEANVAPAVKEALEAGLLCPDCGKKGGNGTNGTCGRFTREKDCPNCGVHVQARTCHTCAN